MNLVIIVLAMVAACLGGGPVLGHDWFSGMTNPETKRVCCGGSDCQAVPHRDLPDGGLAVYANDAWWPVPAQAIHPVPSPDSVVHACWLNRLRAVQPDFICVFRNGLGA